MISLREKGDWLKIKPNILCSKFYRLWITFIIEKSFTETSSWEICFWIKICTLKWEILDWQPKYLSQVKKEEQFVVLQITLLLKYLSLRVIVIKLMSGVSVSLCTLWFMVDLLSNLKTLKKLIKKSSLQFLPFHKEWLVHKI